MTLSSVRSKDEIPDDAYRKMVLTLKVDLRETTALPGPR